MGTEADYLIDQNFDRKHGEYGDEKPSANYHRVISDTVAPVPSVTYKFCPDCARLTKELEETKTVLEAWQNAFGTSQLTHAQARLESAEECCARLKTLLQAAQELIHAPGGNPFEYKLKYDAFQVKLKREGIE